MLSASFMALLFCGRRLDAQQRRVVFLRQHVQIAIGPLTHVADSLLQLSEQRLAPDLLPLLVELNAIDLPRARRLALAQAADEDVPLPAGEHVAGVEGQA